VATFSFSGSLPAFKDLISSSQLTSRFNELKTHLNTTMNPAGLTLPATNGSSGDLLESQGDGTTDWQTSSAIGVASPSVKTTSTTSIAPIAENTINIIDSSAGSITHYLPTSPTSATKVMYFFPGSSWDTDNWTLDGNGTNISGSATQSIDTSAPFAIYHDGTDYEFVIFGGSVS